MIICYVGSISFINLIRPYVSGFVYKIMSIRCDVIGCTRIRVLTRVKCSTMSGNCCKHRWLAIAVKRWWGRGEFLIKSLPAIKSRMTKLSTYLVMSFLYSSNQSVWVVSMIFVPFSISSSKLLCIPRFPWLTSVKVRLGWMTWSREFELSPLWYFFFKNLE